MTIELIISIISAAAAVAALFLPLLKKNGGKETKIIDRVKPHNQTKEMLPN